MIWWPTSSLSLYNCSEYLVRLTLSSSYIQINIFFGLVDNFPCSCHIWPINPPSNFLQRRSLVAESLKYILSSMVFDWKMEVTVASLEKGSAHITSRWSDLNFKSILNPSYRALTSLNFYSTRTKRFAVKLGDNMKKMLLLCMELCWFSIILHIHRAGPRKHEKKRCNLNLFINNSLNNERCTKSAKLVRHPHLTMISRTCWPHDSSSTLSENPENQNRSHHSNHQIITSQETS